MEFFDTHFHLSEEKDSNAYALEAEAEDVAYLLAAGVDHASSREAKRFALKIPNRRFFAAGIHPHEAESSDMHPAEFAEFAESQGFAAFGEVGLDYYYDHSDRKSQLSTFAEFAELASSVGAPMIVHCRSGERENDAAFDDAFGVLEEFARDGGRFVLHCFSGTPEWVEKFAGIGAFFGIAGIVTFKKADNIRSAVALIPNDRLLLETDAPWLAPVPFRGKGNHSKYLPLIAAAVAEVKRVSAAEIAETTTANAFRLFVDWRSEAGK